MHARTAYLENSFALSEMCVACSNRAHASAHDSLLISFMPHSRVGMHPHC